MSYLAKWKKCDLLKIAEKLNIDLPINPRVIQLIKLITESEGYDEEVTKNQLERVKTDRENDEIKERKLEEKEREERREREEKEREERREREKKEREERREREKKEREERRERDGIFTLQLKQQFQLRKFELRNNFELFVNYYHNQKVSLDAELVSNYGKLEHFSKPRFEYRDQSKNLQAFDLIPCNDNLSNPCNGELLKIDEQKLESVNNGYVSLKSVAHNHLYIGNGEERKEEGDDEVERELRWNSGEEDGIESNNEMKEKLGERNEIVQKKRRDEKDVEMEESQGMNLERNEKEILASIGKSEIDKNNYRMKNIYELMHTQQREEN